MHQGGGQDDSVESRDSSPTTTSPRSRSCQFIARGGDPAASPLTLSENGMELTVRERSTARLLEGRNFLHCCLVINECNSQLHHQTKRPSGLKWGSALKTRRLFDPGVCFPPQSLWVLNKTIYCIYSFLCSLYCHLYLAEDFELKHFWSVGMKYA